MRGNPCLYRGEYCEMIIEHMAEGHTYESFAGRLRVHRDTLYNWEKLHPEFAEAKGIARESQLFANEKRILDMAKGKLTKGNVTAQIFIMKNCHGWADKVEQEVTSESIVINISPEDAKL